LTGIRFERAYAQELPFADGGFDRVLSSMMLHHLDDDVKAAAAAEMFRVLRPGGRIAVACWVDVARIPVFNAFREGLIALGWDDLVQTFAAPFSLSGPELESLFTGPSFDDVHVREVAMDLPVGDPREMARIYATVPPFSMRFLAASESDQQRYLDIVTAGRTDTEPFTTSVLTARRPG
jgi:SAM-dependent methyltransferase